jgi:hypothetical protein
MDSSTDRQKAEDDRWTSEEDTVERMDRDEHPAERGRDTSDTGTPATHATESHADTPARDRDGVE